jgi:hypothetical protein
VDLRRSEVDLRYREGEVDLRRSEEEGSNQGGCWRSGEEGMCEREGCWRNVVKGWGCSDGLESEGNCCTH